MKRATTDTPLGPFPNLDGGLCLTSGCLEPVKRTVSSVGLSNMKRATIDTPGSPSRISSRIFCFGGGEGKNALN